MKTGFFLKTAWSNLRKNYRFFIPRILAEAGLMGVFFIVFTLKSDERVLALRGGDYLGEFMSIGTAVLTLLSIVLMLYINSFLMKQRKREFGLYNILGMEKRHVCRILFNETAIASLLSTGLGLGTGLLFYKLCSLLICRLLDAEVVLGMDFIRLPNILTSFGFFLALDLLTYLGNAISIARLKPVELLSSKAAGEKEPRVKWVLVVLGFLSLGGGYYISLTTENPLAAILLFFVAVLLVILGTYFLFTAGSIFVLKALKKNEKYFYQRNHMASVSGLLYRMKQNAVGLASICILATGVLVMISTTVSLYAGAEDTLRKNYPAHDYIPTYYTLYDQDKTVGTQPIPEDLLKETVCSAAADAGLTVEEIQLQHYLEVTFALTDGNVSLHIPDENISQNLLGYCTFGFITEEEYVKMGNEPLGLGKNQIAICSLDEKNQFSGSTMNFCGTTWQIARVLDSYPISSRMVITLNTYGIVLPDEETLTEIYDMQKEAYGEECSEYTDLAAVTFTDLDKAYENGYLFDREVYDTLTEYMYAADIDGISYASGDSIWACKDMFLGMYASLLFLGLLLGFVCLFATVLIIYYKQISEGYEDRERFQIMQKIGMSRGEIKKTINSQVLLVFFLPLVTAGIHLIFAFPILEKLLHILLLSSTRLFILCSLITYGLFAMIYILIYLATARTYYKIVR